MRWTWVKRKKRTYRGVKLLSKKKIEIIILTGDISLKQRKQKIRQIETGNFQVLLATGQLIGEGTDFPNWDCLFLIFPFAFKGKLIQYIGRIQRGGRKGIVYDYRDLKVAYLEKLFKQRLRYYKKNFEIKENPISNWISFTQKQRHQKPYNKQMKPILIADFFRQNPRQIKSSVRLRWLACCDSNRWWTCYAMEETV